METVFLVLYLVSSGRSYSVDSQVIEVSSMEACRTIGREWKEADLTRLTGVRSAHYYCFRDPPLSTDTKG